MKKILALVACGLFLSSCETVSYYGQAVAGQLYILTHRDKIENIIADADTDPLLRDKLTRILEIREFAARELNLPLNDNFDTYVDLERPYAVWNVFATQEFSMQPVKWCYPVAGCVSYRGYFAEHGAAGFAEQLQQEDYDVHVGGVAAYSTLGWFADPVLNTVMHRDDYELASLIFHELAHQVVYIPGDTRFNESFATAVELEGLRRWLEHGDRNDAESARILATVKESMQRREEFVGLVQGTVRELRTLYASSLPPALMRQEKARAFAELREDYAILRQQWGGYSGYDGWFARDLNNAQLNTVATYFNWVPAFSALLDEEGGELNHFFARVHALSEMKVDERQAMLELFDVVESPAISSR